MNVHSILFATDFSPSTEAALQYASALAGEFKATLHIVHVYDATNLGVLAGEAGFAYSLAWEEQRKEAEDKLDQILPTKSDVIYSHHCLAGEPVSELTNFAKENKIDLIVLASHGRSGLSRLLMGSIAEGVMRYATCPVLVVKQPVGEHHHDENHTASQDATLAT